MLNTSKTPKMSRLVKRITLRVLLFGIPFGLSYLATRPAPRQPTFVVCTSTTDRPGELRISLDPAGCPRGEEAKIIPAWSASESALDRGSDKAIDIPF